MSNVVDVGQRSPIQSAPEIPEIEQTGPGEAPAPGQEQVAQETAIQRAPGDDCSAAVVQSRLLAPNPLFDGIRGGGELLRKGSSGDEVRELQRLLNRLGAEPALAEDGELGGATEQAVRAFQQAHGCKVDGIVGPETMAALDRAQGLDVPGSPGERPEGPGRQEPERPGRPGVDPTGPVVPESPLTGPTLDWSKIDTSGAIVPAGKKVTEPDPKALQYAWKAFQEAKARGQVTKDILTVVDYSKSSGEPRMWVIDVGKGKLVAQHYVAHGVGSDRNHDGSAERFSNTPDSNTSSLGVFITGKSFTSKNTGYSMQLLGQERGINDKAKARGVWMHGADYVDDKVVQRQGKAGRSHGCLALDPDIHRTIIDTIKDGSVIFNYYPDQAYLGSSTYLRP